MAWIGLLALAGAEAAMIEGVARDAKGGAVIVLDDGAPVYVDGLDAWPAGVDGLRIRALGEEVAERHVPEATVSPDGAISQGTAPGSALDRVLRPTWWCPTTTPTGPWTVRIEGGEHAPVEIRAGGSADTERIVSLWRSLSAAEALPGDAAATAIVTVGGVEQRRPLDRAQDATLSALIQ
ncbi:MAG: hypothetical protein H6738_12230 [Alphaproteobacteria bacterium]|nr:hypothetical protein [Alphaproteobacteria bacterium]MCB9697539.1 hypothetical protein [Alphaproteobacteria bacterium]